MFELVARKGEIVLVDEDVYERYKNRSVVVDKHGYATVYCSKRKKYYRLHRIVNETPDDLLTDHRDGNRLNCLRKNLRNATHSQNQANRKKEPGKTSQYKGVFYRVVGGQYGYWYAQLKSDGVKVYNKSFPTELEAAIAYDRVAKLIHGEFAKLNFPGKD